MNIFNIIAGSASIVSLLLTLFVYQSVKEIKINMNIGNKHIKNVISSNKISQQAKGENISQVSGDKNG